jgi:hypothetical protein
MYTDSILNDYLESSQIDQSIRFSNNVRRL